MNIFFLIEYVSQTVLQTPAKDIRACHTHQNRFRFRFQSTAANKNQNLFCFLHFPVEAFRFSFWINFLRRFGSTEVFRFEATLDTQRSTQTFVMDLTFLKMNDSNRLHAFQFELGTDNLSQNNRSTADIHIQTLSRYILNHGGLRETGRQSWP